MIYSVIPATQRVLGSPVSFVAFPLLAILMVFLVHI